MNTLLSVTAIAACLGHEAIASDVWGHTSDETVLAGADGATLEELEIVAGHVWNAMGGAEQGEVQVHQVDPKRFGIEIAPAETVEWATGDEGDSRTSTLSTLRAYKPLDMMVVERVIGGDGTVAVVAGLTDIKNIEINGVNQFNSKNQCPSACFGTVLSAPRPKVRFDTVQTSPALSAILIYAGGTIAASAIARASLVFSGVAVKR